MARFFPDVETSTAARTAYRAGTLAEALAIARGADLATPREHDLPEMIEEFASLLESLGVPDRDGTDIAVIVPIAWNGRSLRNTVGLDFGRRLLTLVNHPVFGTGPLSDEILFCDLHLPQNLRHELLTVLVTYRNVEERAGDTA